METVSAARLRAERRRLETEKLGDQTDRLFRAALLLTGSYQDAQDLVKETFAQVLQRPRHLRGDTDLESLLHVLQNTRSSATGHGAQADGTVELVDDRTSVAPTGGAEGGDLIAAVRALPEPYRQAVVAVDVVGLTYKEAARALGTREGTILTRLSRGRKKLADVVDRRRE